MLEKRVTMALVFGVVGLALVAGDSAWAQNPLYAVTGRNNMASVLYELNPATGAVLRTIGATGDTYITAMDFDPISGNLYAFAQDPTSGSRGDILILDLDTGVATRVAQTLKFTDMGFHPDGRLFGQLKPHASGSDGLYQINITTGATTQLLSLHPHTPGVTFDSLGNGLFKSGNSVSAFDPDGPTLSFLGNISGSSLLNTFEFGEDDILYSTTFSSLVSINMLTQTQTILGPIPNRYTALASQDEQCFVVEAVDDQFNLINDGSTANLTVLSNDRCRSDRPISVVAGPTDLMPDRGGVAITNGTTVRYTPALGYVGFEEFSYTAQDAGLDGGDDPPSVDQDSARVVMNVLEDLIPDAIDDAATTNQGQTIFIDVLANDTLGNPDHETTIESAPSNGSAILQSDGTIRYSPSYNFFGEDSFEYRLTDENGDFDIATVTIGVFFVSGTVPMDVMPHDDGNNINLRSGPGAGIDVAILSVGEFFQAPLQVAPLTLKLGPRQANIWGTPRVKDVNSDGEDDLVVHFLIQQLGVACGDTQIFMIGRTPENRQISASDVINTFNCPRVRKRH
jgi:hypothetical protein